MTQGLDKRYWFPAKKSRRGWRLLKTWQGWATLLVWHVVLISVLRRIRLEAHYKVLWSLLWMVLMTGVLLGTMWLKGEPLGRGDGQSVE